MLAASSFLIKTNERSRDVHESEPADSLLQQALTKGGRFVCGTCTCICPSSTLVVVGNFAGASPPLLPALLSLAVPARPCLLPPLAFSLPARRAVLFNLESIFHKIVRDGAHFLPTHLDVLRPDLPPVSLPVLVRPVLPCGEDMIESSPAKPSIAAHSSGAISLPIF